MQYRYFELIDDLGQDYYRIDDSGEVETWSQCDEVWYCGDITSLDELYAINESTWTRSFQEVTEDDVR